ncbi:melatonin receptor type 1A [Eubalaena glacialis]|uniref:melatonin receptor type 1A n=1 Tax=Eubalaena glacialis TaxID=27606 RepID=UPI002A5A66B3|nr:melatonin receptor type 1A [Eubalaena glacialis]XP_061033534.1 melatonin receptor type 1A [Eubalaena glacialis]
MARRPWGAPGGTSKGNGSALLEASQQAPSGGEGARPRPLRLASRLALVLIFTIVVDILSVYRNKKLRNADGDSSLMVWWPNWGGVSSPSLRCPGTAWG